MTVDQRSAYAGASLILSQYYEKNENAAEDICKKLEPLISMKENQESGGTADPFIFENPKLGVVCTPGNLNIRSSETVLSEIVAKAYQGMQLYVEGEHLVRGNIWFKVRANGIEGYCVSQYVLFGAEAEQYFVNLHEQEKVTAVMPASFAITDDLSKLSAEVLKQVDHYTKQINYVLKYDYPKQSAAENYLNVYSVMVYLLENYQHLQDISIDYGLKKTYDTVHKDMRTINLLMERLTDNTGTTSEEFAKKIQDEIAKRKAEERAKQLTPGQQMANYAATFVGWLPYVWGGTSLQKGADCSGFAAQIYAHFGYCSQQEANSHRMDSLSMRGWGRAVDISQIHPGDLVCYNGHVAIYYGGGLVVHEPAPGRKCEFGSLYMMPIIGIRRLW
ncbi:MAG: C40 family peptidase [Lachnospiraceae bacterium]|nr:C40 family peptidase [Lachnospiraceae bacterium]